jgi:prolyl-tRNA synthetase
MRFRALFLQTLREVPAEAELAGHRLLARAGFLQPIAGGAFGWLPLAARSYRQLHRLLFARASLPGPEPAGRLGPLGVRGFPELRVFDLQPDEPGQEASGGRLLQGFGRLMGRCGLADRLVTAEAGTGCTEQGLYFPVATGPEPLLACPVCGTAAERCVAAWRRPPVAPEEPRPLDTVETPGVTTITALARFLGVPEERTAKAVMRVADERELIFAVLRGDLEVSEEKLARALGGVRLRPATEEEIHGAGAEPGYASPVGLRGWRVVVDELIPAAPNLIAGANREGRYLRNVNYGRDYTAEIVADIAAPPPGASCPRCGGPLEARPVAALAELCHRSGAWAERRGCLFLDRGGRPRPVRLASACLNLGRLLAAVAEEHRDEQGLDWPLAVAPYPLHLVALKGAFETAERVYRELQAAGFEALYDDREERPGVKFTDADLIGLPLRITVSERTLKGQGVELKPRRSAERRQVPESSLLPAVVEELRALEERAGAAG